MFTFVNILLFASITERRGIKLDFVMVAGLRFELISELVWIHSLELPTLDRTEFYV